MELISNQSYMCLDILILVTPLTPVPLNTSLCTFIFLQWYYIFILFISSDHKKNFFTVQLCQLWENKANIMLKLYILSHLLNQSFHCRFSSPLLPLKKHFQKKPSWYRVMSLSVSCIITSPNWNQGDENHQNVLLNMFPLFYKVCWMWFAVCKSRHSLFFNQSLWELFSRWREAGAQRAANT